jgi:predicted amidophosphoribosyltransferase
LFPFQQEHTARGFNQSALLAKYISDEVGVTFEDILLDKGKKNPQHLTPYNEKEKNVAATIECKEDLGGKSVLLIDGMCLAVRESVNRCGF